MIEKFFVGCDTFADAVGEWADSLEEPPSWNDFQRSVGPLAAHYEDAPPVADRAAYAALRCTVMKQRFGEEWKKLVPKSALAQALAEERRRPEDALLADGTDGDGSVVGPAVAPCPVAGGPAGSGAVGSQSEALVPVAPDGIGTVAGPGTGRGAGSEGALAESAIVPLVPRKLDGELESAGVAEAAVNVPSAVELLIAPGVRAVQERHAAEGSETSSVFDSRIAGLCGALEAQGLPGAAVVQSARVEACKRKLIRTWAEETEESAQPLVTWSALMIGQDRAHLQPPDYESGEALLLALAHFAEVTDQQLMREVSLLKAKHAAEAAERDRSRVAATAGRAAAGGQGRERAEAGAASPSRAHVESGKGKAWAAASPTVGMGPEERSRTIRNESPEPAVSSTPIPSSTPQPSATPLPSSTSVLNLTPNTGGENPLGALLNAFNATQTKLVEAVQGMRVSHAPEVDGDTRSLDKVNALAGLEFKQTLPVLKDSDTDFDRHWRQFESIIDCHAFGRKSVRPYDMLVVFRKTLAPGSSRLRMFNTCVERARKAGRLPHESKEVLEEIKKRLKAIIRETSFQKEDRLDKEFEALTMKGHVSHSEFRTLWEEKLEEMDDAGMQLDVNTLKRKYLSKISSDLRRAVLGQSWPLDGEGTPLRKPGTWEEVAEAVELELESRADARAPLDQVSAMGQEDPVADGLPTATPTQKCRHCLRTGHPQEACPKRAAEQRGDVARLIAESWRTGKCCAICGFGDHREHHHRLAASDAHYTVQKNGRLSWAGQRGSGSRESTPPPPPQPKGKGRGGESPRETRPCPYGKRCMFLDRAKGRRCSWYHQESEYYGEAPSPSPGRGSPAEQKCFQCGKTKDEHPDRRFCQSPLKGERGAAGQAGAKSLSAGTRGSSNGGRGDHGMCLTEGERASEQEQLAPVFDRVRLLAGPVPQRSGTDPTAWLAARMGNAGKSALGAATLPGGEPKGRRHGDQRDSALGTGRRRKKGHHAASLERSDEVRRAVDGVEPKEELEATGREGNLSELFRIAEHSGAIRTVTSLQALPTDEYEVRKHPRPAGYAAQTRLFFGGMPVPALLDWGATCSAIPEEVVCVLLEHVLEQVADGTLCPESELYPVVRLERYSSPTSLGGVAAGAPMVTKYGIVLRAEFVPIGAETTAYASGKVEKHPFRDLYFKVLPKGSCSMSGCLVGFPVLDCEPHGLGHRVTEGAHVFDELGVALPRGELGRRADMRESLEEYYGGNEAVARLAEERVSYLSESLGTQLKRAARLVADKPCAVFDAADFALEPGEQAIVPVRWNAPIPEEDFACATDETLYSGVTALPGVCPGKETALQMCVENTSNIPQVMERGRVVATTAEMDEGMVLYPRGCQRGAREYSTASVPVAGTGNREREVGACADEVRRVEESAESARAGPLIVTGGELMALEEGYVDKRALDVDIVSPRSSDEGQSDELSHLVQDDDLIARVHDTELPPDEYYDGLRDALRKKFPTADPDLVDHVVPLVAAFDTAVGFALSFGIAKFQLAQKEVKLVGEYVGELGRRPNPDLIKAIKAWPEIRDLKDLQSFLGTTNYARPHAGPAYARVMNPLRALMKPGAEFPPNEEQKRAIQGLKDLMEETHRLAVPDEEAAVRAAAAWLSGEPPAGRPYEAGADTSKIAMGGVMGQPARDNGKLLILLYWSAPLTLAQSQWHPFEQEFLGLLQLRREVVKHFGRIPIIMHTDHGTLTRLEYLPLPRVEPKHFRWHAELTSGGSLLLYRAGEGVLHKCPDALSRHPPPRDQLILARTGDWDQQRRIIRGLEHAIHSGEFACEEPGEPPTWEEACAETMLGPEEEKVARVAPPSRMQCVRCGDTEGCPCAVLLDLEENGTAVDTEFVRTLLARPSELDAHSAGTAPFPGAEAAEGQEQSGEVESPGRALGSGGVDVDAASTSGAGLAARGLTASVPLTVLLLGPFALHQTVEQVRSRWEKELTQQMRVEVRLVSADPPFDVPEALDGKGYWVKPTHPKADERKKLLRKQTFTSVVATLASVVRHQARIILGVGQGALISALMGQPLLVEAACRARIVTSREMVDFRRAWAAVVGLISVDPVVLPQRSELVEVRAALPELSMLQPRGVHRTVVLTDGRSQHAAFGRELAAEIGTAARLQDDLELVYEDLRAQSEKPVPVYFEDDASGLGACAVCGKRGALGRCVACGLLMHHTCVSPHVQGHEQICPRCVPSTEPGDQDGGSATWGYLRKHKFEKGALAPARVGLERGLDARLPCPLDERPTDEEAVAHGFQNALEWYAYSAGGGLLDPRTVKANFEALPSKDPEEPAESELAQQWRMLLGDRDPLSRGSNDGVVVSTNEEKDAVAHVGCCDEIVAAAHVPKTPRGGVPTSRAVDELAGVADALSFSHPYLMSDVEPLFREEVLADLRERLSTECRQIWQEDTTGGGAAVIPFQASGELTAQGLRAELRKAQRSDPTLKAIVMQKVAELDPEAAKKRVTGEPKAVGPLRPLEAKEYRLAPMDGVLEFRVVLAVAALWVPILPSNFVPFEAAPLTWRKWAWTQAHETFMNPHRGAAETFQVLRRMGYWKTLAADCADWCAQCQACMQHRSHAVQPPMRSMLADDGMLQVLPWLDVVVDVQGPFTKSDTGEQYVLSYHCTRLKVPLLQPFRSLQSGYFSRALVACVMRSRQIPEVVRTDRGPEMISAVMKEFLAICNVRHVKGASLTPRHQGLGERGHQIMMTQHLLLMHSVCHAFPQEWPALVPAVEYLYHTSPQGVHGLSAHDMTAGYAIVSATDKKLAPFLVPKGLPETEVAARLFANFRELYGVFSRISMENSMKAQLYANHKRHDRTLEPGETVFRRLPAGSRPPKHLLPEPSKGPYIVESQPTSTSVVLRNPETQELVDGGAKIPLDQILSGPRRAQIEFEGDSEVRGVGGMMRKEGLTGADPVGVIQRKAGRRTGWGPLATGAYVAYQTVNEGPRSRELTVGRVLVNHREERRVTLQPYRGCWRGVRVAHVPQYQTREGYSDEVSPNEARESVRYEALVLQVELFAGGELDHSSARRLSDRGWGLLVELEEVVAFLRRAGGGAAEMKCDGGASHGTALGPRVGAGSSLPPSQSWTPWSGLPEPLLLSGAQFRGSGGCQELGVSASSCSGRAAECAGAAENSSATRLRSQCGLGSGVAFSPAGIQGWASSASADVGQAGGRIRAGEARVDGVAAGAASPSSVKGVAAGAAAPVDEGQAGGRIRAGEARIDGVDGVAAGAAPPSSVERVVAGAAALKCGGQAGGRIRAGKVAVEGVAASAASPPFSPGKAAGAAGPGVVGAEGAAKSGRSSDDGAPSREDFREEEVRVLAQVGAQCAVSTECSASKREVAPLARSVVTELGDAVENVARLAGGRRTLIAQGALAAMAYGHRVSFLELFSGMMLLTLGVRAHGLLAPDGIDSSYPLGGRRWDLSSARDQKRCRELVRSLEPLVVHGAPPCTKLCAIGPKEGQGSYDARAFAGAVAIVAFVVKIISEQVMRGCAGSLENPLGSRAWGLAQVRSFFGTRDCPRPGKYFVQSDMCQFGLVEPGNPELFWRKSLVVAATYAEIRDVERKCTPGEHVHQAVRGSVKTSPEGPWESRAALSAAYPFQAALVWGRAVAKACFRLSSVSAEAWAERERKRVAADPVPPRPVEVRLEEAEAAFAIWDPRDALAVFADGHREPVFREPRRPRMDGLCTLESRGVAVPESDLAVPAGVAREGADAPRWADRAAAEAVGRRTWARTGSAVSSPAHRAWMARLVAGDLGGLDLDRAQYMELRGTTVEGNPRATAEYKQRCVEAVGLGAVPDPARYSHITGEDNFELLRWAVRRGSGCMWLPESPRTCVRGFKHRLVTRGPPVRVPMHRLSKPDTEWIETAIREDVERGQLIKGSSEWGFPAFPTREEPSHKAVHRKRRMVVDYRQLNRVTVRKTFLIPNSDYIKSSVSGSKYISVGDLKEGFNQVDNEPETSQKMAVLAASGTYLPRGLTFGPTNGPEDFQDLVFNVFARRLYREWYLFLDDLSVATGREASDPDKPSGAADVWGCLDEVAAKGSSTTSSSGALKADAALKRCVGGTSDGGVRSFPHSGERRGSAKARRY